MRTNPSTSRPFFQSLRRVTSASALVVLGLTMVGTAAAAAPSPSLVMAPRLVGDVTWTATSGHTSVWSDVLAPPERASQFAIRQMSWSERSDRPCWAAGGFTSIAANEYSNDYAVGCTKHNASTKGVLRGELNEVITGVQVCLNSGANRMKGIRIWGRTVDRETAALGPINGPAEAKRKHCKEWSPRVDCPPGQVAAEVKLFGLKPGVKSSTIKGISLGCREVAMRPAAQPLPQL